MYKNVLYPVIHFRCADTPFIRHPRYHFQKYEFYKTALNKIKNDKNISYDKVILLSCTSHNSNDKNKTCCNTYSNSLSSYLKYINYNSIIECKTYVEDFATLFYAPAVISIGSSYSFMSGFFGNGIFISGGHLEEIDDTHKCTSCDDWLLTNYDIKHKNIDDYYDTYNVIAKL